MRRLFWLIVLIGGYMWFSTSDKDHFILEKARALYEFASNWVKDADVDFQLKDNPKKKSRRWD